MIEREYFWLFRHAKIVVRRSALMIATGRLLLLLSLRLLLLLLVLLSTTTYYYLLLPTTSTTTIYYYHYCYYYYYYFCTILQYDLFGFYVPFFDVPDVASSAAARPIRYFIFVRGFKFLLILPMFVCCFALRYGSVFVVLRWCM